MVVCLIDYLFGFVLLCFSALFGSFFRKIRPHLSPPCGCLSRSDGPQEVPGAALISRSISFRVAERPAAVTAHDMPGEGPCFFRAGEHSSRGFSPAGAPPPAPAPPRGPRSAQPTGRFPRGGARKAAQSGTAPPSPDEDSARPQRALLYGGEAPPPHLRPRVPYNWVFDPCAGWKRPAWPGRVVVPARVYRRAWTGSLCSGAKAPEVKRSLGGPRCAGQGRVVKERGCSLSTGR